MESLPPEMQTAMRSAQCATEMQQSESVSTGAPAASRDFSRAESRYTTPSERALSDDPLWPGIVWCAKEALYKYSGRRELDFRKDLRIGSADLAAGRLTGRIGNGEPVELSVHREDGFILVCIL